MTECYTKSEANTGLHPSQRVILTGGHGVHIGPANMESAKSALAKQRVYFGRSRRIVGHEGTVDMEPT